MKRDTRIRGANLTAVVSEFHIFNFLCIYHSSNPSVKYGDLNHDGILSERKN